MTDCPNCGEPDAPLYVFCSEPWEEWLGVMHCGCYHEEPPTALYTASKDAFRGAAAGGEP